MDHHMLTQISHKDDFPENGISNLLHWNADTTRISAEMHSFYLRNMYPENNLVRPGGHSGRGGH